MQARDPLRVITFQTSPQKVCEQLVVAEPFPIIVDPTQKQVALLGFVEHRLPVAHTRQRGRQIAANSLDNRGGHQEVEHVRVE
nr:hypothetical protein CPGR_02613 [Mycolicibacterium malmesburyense]